MIYARISIAADAILSPRLDPPPCLAFPGGAFARALSRETHELVESLTGRPRRWWYDGPHKGPIRQTPRAAGNLHKRARKASRRQR